MKTRLTIEMDVEGMTQEAAKDILRDIIALAEDHGLLHRRNAGEIGSVLMKVEVVEQETTLRG